MHGSTKLKNTVMECRAGIVKQDVNVEGFLQRPYDSSHRRRLVINIGGAKIWVTNIGRAKI